MAGNRLDQALEAGRYQLTIKIASQTFCRANTLQNGQVDPSM